MRVITVPQPAKQFLASHWLQLGGDGVSPLQLHCALWGARQKTVFHWEGMSWWDAAFRECATNV